MTTVKVVWKPADGLAQIALAEDQILTAMAFTVEGNAKLNVTDNGQVDTGFMRNSIYTVAPNGQSDPAPSGTLTSSKTGRQVEREALPPLNAPEGTAIVAVAAEYGLIQEIRDPFLFPALEEAAGQFNSVAGQVKI